jgi:short subunit dehydrogenase-like uncharacterized protein
MNKLMIYGATGYTGRMAAEHAKAAAGTPIVLAGRNEAPLVEARLQNSASNIASSVSTMLLIDRSLTDVSS